MSLRESFSNSISVRVLKEYDKSLCPCPWGSSFLKKSSKFDVDFRNKAKISQRTFVFEITALDWIAVNSPYYKDNTYDPQ